MIREAYEMGWTSPEGLQPNRPLLKKETGVTDGTRTHDGRNHNPGLYQLSYDHHIRKGEPAIIQ